MKLTIYSKPGCPYCEKIKQVGEYLEGLNVCSMTVYTLDENFTREQFYKEFGQGSTFPQVILDDKHLGGCTDAVRYLQENNII